MVLGNPGTGKSTLLNSLIGSCKFPSGLSSGVGKTRKLKAVTMPNNVTFIDTPGLADRGLRSKTAKDITAALKEGGKFKLILVTGARSCRILEDDFTTMKLVLDAVPAISANQYGIIFNQIRESEYERLQSKEDFASFLKPVWALLQKITFQITLLKFDQALDGRENSVKAFPDLDQLLVKLQTVEITPSDVQEVESRDFQQVLEEFQTLTKDEAKLEEEFRKKAPLVLEAYKNWSESEEADGNKDGSGWSWGWWAAAALLALLAFL